MSCQHVRSLVYITDLLPTRLLSEEEYQILVAQENEIWCDGKRFRARGPLFYGLELLRPEGRNPIDISSIFPNSTATTSTTTARPYRYLRLEDEGRLMKQISRGYRKYKQLFKWQTEALKQGHDRRFLQRIFAIFTNVQHITVAARSGKPGDGADWLSGERRRGGRFEGGQRVVH